MWLDLAIALSCGGGGLVCGWIMHAIGGFGNHQLVKQAAASITKSELGDEPNRERISEVANRLKAYASAMAADVDAHQTKVQEVNNSLIEGNDSSPESVLRAVSQLIEANEGMQTQLQQAQDRIHEQSVQIESAERRAETDALTRVPNRGAFDKHIKKQHECGVGRAGTLALLDVDHFKRFNDVYGHRAGDEVLRVVAGMLHARLNSYGLVARFGGEEFAVILDGCPVDRAKHLVEEARHAIGEREIQYEEKRLRVTASAGVAELSDEESIDQWLERADVGLYASKEAGRDCGHWMDDSVAVRIEKAQTKSTKVAASAEPEANPKADKKPIPDASELLAETGVDSVSESERASDPTAFAYLPDRKTLGAAFAEIRGRTQSSVALSVMAIRCIEGTSNASVRSLLQIVRAGTRSVDHIGCEDDQTLLVCMPSVDEDTALERATQILRSVDAIGLASGESSECPVRIGVTQAGAEEEFGDIVSRAMDRMSNGDPAGLAAVCPDGNNATA